MRQFAALLLLLTLSATQYRLEARTPVHSKHAMVVAEEPIATDVGVAVLKAGGNAVDAAVAIGFALAVTHPAAGNIGGGGFMLARFADGRSYFLDFRERAPAKASRDMYLDESGKPTRDSIEGWRAAGVPGTVRGLEMAHKKLGRKSWRELVQPSVDLAANGFTVSYPFSRSLESDRILSQFSESRRIFVNGGKGFQTGDKLVQPELARVLDRIAKQGSKDFYEGETARKLAAGMAANGGLITLDDLKNYKAVERTPLVGRYKGYDILTAPPPSSGGIGILQMLGMLELSGYEKNGLHSAAEIHYVAEAMRRFYADRSKHFGDPDFFRVPASSLLDPAYIASRRASINPDRATSSESLSPGVFAAGKESGQTTHFSIVDAEGNAVSLTYTLNGSYGSGVTVPGLGFLLNNEMDDFAAKPGEPNMFKLVQGEGNAIQPGKTPLSSMTPTIVTKDGELFLVVGGPGGGRIISSVLQVMLNVIDFGLNVQDAIDRPRFHHQWQPDVISMEAGFSPDTIRLLESRGHKVDASISVARIEAIHILGGWIQGGADGRGYGKAEGY